MFYDSLDDSDDLEDPAMPPTTSQDTSLLQTPHTPVVASDWNDDMLPLRAYVHPESHLEIKSSIRSAEISANPTVMIDSGATSAFINTTLVRSLGLPLLLKSHSRHLYTVNGSKVKGGSVKHEVEVSLILGDHSEIIRLDVADIGRHEIILGMPWLVRHNPFVDWDKHRIAFISLHCSDHCLPSRADVLGEASVPLQSGASMKEGRPHVLVEEEEEEPSVDSEIPRIAPRVSFVNAAAFQLSSKGSIASGTLWVRDPVRAAEIAAAQSKSAKIAEEHQKPKQDVKDIVPSEFHEFLDVFEKKSADHLPERRPYDLTIDLLPGTTPPFKPMYGLSPSELEVLKEYIDENLGKGHIRHSKSPAGAPVLFVKKKDGSLRLCVDYRGLNTITVKNRYPLPLPNEILDRLQGAKHFTKIDLRAGYSHVRIAEGDEWKTAFRTRYGHFEYCIMPFGLTNAPAAFQHMMNDVFRDLLDVCVIIYLDDILIYSKDAKSHRKAVREVLRRMRQHNLYAKPEKCDFIKDEIEYLGFIISEHGVKMDPAKIEGITDWPTPKSVKDIQVFLGFANFYRRSSRTTPKSLAQ